MLKIAPASLARLGTTVTETGDSGTVNWVLGQDMFHKYFTVFDIHNWRIGFIEQGEPDSILERIAKVPKSATTQYDTMGVAETLMLLII